jgi:penicillin-binding protein 2
MNARLSRRLFLKLAMASLASACVPIRGEQSGQLPTQVPGVVPTEASGPQVGLSIPGLSPATPTAVPTPTPTPLPSADGAATVFLSAWSAGDYGTMYELLIDTDRQTIPFEQFRARYVDSMAEAAVAAVQNEIRSILHENLRATASFHTVWHTGLFGALNFDNTMPLVWEGGRWAVDWSSALVLPQLADDLSLMLLGQTAMRGNIYERNGLGLAVQGERVAIGLVPGRIQDETTVINQVSAITGVSPDVIRRKLAAARPEWFVEIKVVSPEVSINNDEILSSLPGVDRQKRMARAYKNGSLAAHLIGYMGTIPPEEVPEWRSRGYRGDELVGRSGVEGWGEVQLAGKRGGRLVTKTSQYREVAVIAEAPPRPGDSIYLTIDKGLQADAENILGQRLGAIVVLEPSTGFVLAMASYPRFDPNQFVDGLDAATWAALRDDTKRALWERGAQGTYPAGSIFKIATMIAGMEKLGLTAESPFTCNGRWNRLGSGFTKTCWLKSGHGQINLQNGLTQSCDVVFYEIGLALQNTDPQILPDVARACGLGNLTGISGVQEVAGVVPDRQWKLAEKGESWFPGDTVNLAIGQGDLQITPLQIANLVAAIANGGMIYRPQLIHRIVERAGTERVSQPEVKGYLPVSPQNLAVIRAAMEGVVKGPRGTAREAFADATFTCAGKTGTSETSREEPHAWFAGYAPAEAPQVAIAVVLENAGEGSKLAAPVFRQIVEAYLARQVLPFAPQSVPTVLPSP